MLMKSGGSNVDFKKALSMVSAGGINNMFAEWIVCKLLEGDSTVIVRTMPKDAERRSPLFAAAFQM